MILRITAPHFCAAIIPGGAYAPILAYMKGWPAHRIIRYAQGKGWLVEVM